MSLLSELKSVRPVLKSTRSISKATKNGVVCDWDVESRFYGLSEERRNEVLDRITADLEVERAPDENLGYLKSSAQILRSPMGTAAEYFLSKLISWLIESGGVTVEEMVDANLTFKMSKSEVQSPQPKGLLSKALGAVGAQAAGGASAHSQLLTSNHDHVHTYSIVIECSDDNKSWVRELAFTPTDWDMSSSSSAPAALAIFVRANLEALNTQDPDQITFSVRSSDDESDAAV